MAEIRVNSTGGVKLFDADDSHYAQIKAGTISSNTDVLELGSSAVVAGTKVDLNGQELILDADADTSITADTDDQIDIRVAGTDQLTIKDGALSPVTDNDVDIGTSSLEFKDGYFDGTLHCDVLDLAGTEYTSIPSLAGIDDQSSSNDDQLTITDTAVVINEDSDDVDFRVESNGNANMLFVSGGNDVVGIGAEGDLGVGLHVKSADSGASVNSGADELVVEGSADAGLSILSGTDANGSIMFGDSADNDGGRIQYNPQNDRMLFTTNGSERMRIISGGSVGIGATAASPNPNFYFQVGSNAQLHIGHDSNCASGQYFLPLMFNGSAIGGITQNGTTGVAYNTSSDYRLKENVDYTWDATTRLKQLKPARFNFIADETNTLVDGFIAHEVTPVVPESINGTKDATETYKDENGDDQTKIIPQGIDQSKLVPLLTKALQEAITEIESLKARVTTLEG